MKKWKCFVAALALFSVMTTGFCPLAAAAEEPTNQPVIQYDEDGFYSVTTILYEEQQINDSTRATEQKITGEKQIDTYDESHQLLWTLWVHGTFTYNGSSARATSATYSYQIYNPNWTFKSGRAYCSGASAIATATFQSSQNTSKTTTVRLTCSPTGQLS